MILLNPTCFSRSCDLCGVLSLCEPRHAPPRSALRCEAWHAELRVVLASTGCWATLLPTAPWSQGAMHVEKLNVKMKDFVFGGTRCVPQCLGVLLSCSPVCSWGGIFWRKFSKIFKVFFKAFLIF